MAYAFHACPESRPTLLRVLILADEYYESSKLKRYFLAVMSLGFFNIVISREYSAQTQAHEIKNRL